ncbi:MAG: response regulator transcription factor [Gemmatimonadota bacterium]|nr:response regulator transcription factor [Gemmatimonadota bacterium]
MTVKPPISLVLIDDHPPASVGFVSRLRTQAGFHVLAVVTEVEAALQQVREIGPDIVLLNLLQSGHESLTLAGVLRGVSPGSRVIIMGLTAAPTDVAGFLRAGVSGFLMADASFERFCEVVTAVAAGVSVLPRELTHNLFGQIQRHGVQGRPKPFLGFARLTPRERQVADLIVEGTSNREISQHLKIGLPTVKKHVHYLLAKLSINSRLEVAAFARLRGKVPSAPPGTPAPLAGPVPLPAA